jgi:radical SAM-linked protein
VIRLRLRHTKLGKLRFISHRDIARLWERALRKADMPVAYTAGFSPRPKLAFGLALSTGHESVAEYLDIELRPDEGHEIDVMTLPDRLNEQLPPGIDVTAAAPLAPGTLSLQESVTSCTWRIEVPDLDPAAVSDLATAALAADALVLTRVRKGKEVTDDLRPAILSVTITGPTATGTELEAELAVHPRSVRPAELLLAMSPEHPLVEGRVLRVAQWTWRDGARHEPLATSQPPREDPDVRPRVVASVERAQPQPIGAPLLA